MLIHFLTENMLYNVKYYMQFITDSCVNRSLNVKNACVRRSVRSLRFTAHSGSILLFPPLFYYSFTLNGLKFIFPIDLQKEQSTLHHVKA